MYYCTSQDFEERQDHFVCSTSRKKGKDVCGTHFIRAVVLEKGVLKFLQILLWYISDCENLFRDKLGAKRKEDFKKELAAKRRQLTQAQRRMEELDRLFKRLYEDNISGKINDSRFEKLSADYENEQAELTEKMQLLEQEIAQQEEEADSIEQFIRWELTLSKSGLIFANVILWQEGIDLGLPDSTYYRTHLCWRRTCSLVCAWCNHWVTSCIYSDW